MNQIEMIAKSALKKVKVANSQLAQKANKTQEAWITPTLLEGWANMSAGRNLYYRKNNFGNIEFKGGVVNATGVGTNIMQLPLGYRPSISVNYTVVYGSSIVRLYIGSDGNVALYSVTAGSSLELNHVTINI